MSKVITLLSIITILLLTGCFEERASNLLYRKLGSDSPELINLKYIERDTPTSSWSASGGFFLVAGGFQAQGKSEIRHEEIVQFAIKIPKDESILMLSIPLSKTRIIYSDKPRAKLLVEIARPFTSRRSMVENLDDMILEIIFYVPEGSELDYLRYVFP